MPKRRSDVTDVRFSSPGRPQKATERVHADLGRILKEQNFASIEDANEFMAKLLRNTGGVLPKTKPATPLEQAQDLCFDAWDAPSPRRAVALAKEALRLSPDCADAYNILAAMDAQSPEEALLLYEQGVAAGERALGAKFFEENKGYFWGITETRPYMRAREGVAQCLWMMGRTQEAADHYRALIELNPNDNQGNRSALLAIHFQQGRIEDAEELLKRYPDDALADFAWGRVLAAILRGDEKGARRHMREALRMNPHVGAYLSGKKRMPKHIPQSVDWGQPSEAAAYVRLFGSAWRSRPEAMDWLRQQTVRQKRS